MARQSKRLPCHAQETLNNCRFRQAVQRDLQRRPKAKVSFTQKNRKGIVFPASLSFLIENEAAEEGFVVGKNIATTECDFPALRLAYSLVRDGCCVGEEVLLFTCLVYCCIVRFYFVIVDLAVVLQSEASFDSYRIPPANGRIACEPV